MSSTILSTNFDLIFVYGLKIFDISILNPPMRSLAGKKRNSPEFQIKVCHNHETRTSARVAVEKMYDELRGTWNESFSFACNITDDSVVTFTVVGAHILYSKTIGSCKEKVVDLLERQRSHGLCKLEITKGCQLTFKIEELSDLLREVIDDALNTSANLSTFEGPGKVASFITSTGQIFINQEETWSSFLFQFQVFMEAMEKFAEISPYAKFAWSILSVIPKAILARKECNEKVKKLCDKLKDIYDFITDTINLPDLTKTQATGLAALVKQTIECAYFIKEYCTKNTVKNTFKAITSGMGEKIKDLNEKLDYFMNVMTNSTLFETSRVALETNITTLRVSEQVSELKDLMLLGEMPYDRGAGFIPGKKCFPGTRQTLINEILEWVNNDASPQILVVSGQAGTGKSAIAHTIAGLFREQNRLGSIFCFNRSFKERRNFLFSTIARDLADGDIEFRRALIKAVDKAAVRTSKDPMMQFQALIVEPSNEVTTIGPIVIVIDALDESGERTERRDILNLLFNRCFELPKNYRIVLTSRPEQDVERLCNSTAVPCKRMGDIDADETCSDIHTYISSCLSPISQILDTIDENWCNVLARHAGNLFQWAQTACQFIDPTIEHAPLIKEKWTTCVSDSSSSLHGLYRQIIFSQSESNNPAFLKDFKTIVGAIITAREPLSISVLQNIFQDIQGVKTILSPFGSLFVGIHDSFTPVRPLHISLFDFFDHRGTANKRNEYYIDTLYRGHMTLACLKLMNRMLCFNICQLETSHLRNRDVPHFDIRVKEAIPLHLSYSCRFWAYHLQHSDHDEDLIREIRGLMGCNLLYLFEVLSLLGEVDQGRVALRKLADWCTGVDEGLAADALDAWDFGYEFGDVMTESTPHLYLSALPFTPQDSFVSRKYLPSYPGLFSFDIGRPVGSSQNRGIMRKHTFGFTRRYSFGFFREDFFGTPSSLAFSPKGRYIASVSDSGEFWLWDYKTGELVDQYLRNDSSFSGHADIVFSLDGEFIYCCWNEGTILVRNNRTNEMHIESYGEMLLGPGDHYHSCTISSDGRFIALWKDMEGLIYDRKNNVNLGQFDKCGFAVSHPVFSPNGDFLAFKEGSQICVWNTRKQALDVLSKCAEDTDLALTDGYIAFRGNSVSLLEIWDVRISTKVTEIQHDTFVDSFRFSPDNQYILSSCGNTYFIWNVSKKQLISRSSVDNTIFCLAFSYDTKSIALGAFGGAISIRQWDTSIQSPRSHCLDDSVVVDNIWLRGTYLILRYSVDWQVDYLQISDITTTDTIFFEAELASLVPPVCPDKEPVQIAYVTCCGLCLWDEKKGEVIVDESGHPITALASSSKYLVSADTDGSRNEGLSKYGTSTPMT